MLLKKIMPAAIVALTLSGENTVAATNAYLNLTGDTQGDFSTTVDQMGTERGLVINGLALGGENLCESASGLPTSKRQHAPLNITKNVNRASPLFMSSLATNENIANLTLQVFSVDESGEADEQQYFTIELVNAQIAGIRMEQLNNKYPENMKHEVREHIQFCYQKIMWTFPDGRRVSFTGKE